MNCACDVEYSGDFDRPSFFTASDPVARKNHTCCECRRDILPGECYRKSTGAWDGEVQTYKTCADCLSIRSAFFSHGHVFGAMHLDLREHLAESRGQVSSECIVALTPAARERVFSMIEETWEDDAA